MSGKCADGLDVAKANPQIVARHDRTNHTPNPRLPGRSRRAAEPDGSLGLFRNRRLPARADLQRLRCVRQAALRGDRQAGPDGRRRAARHPPHGRSQGPHRGDRQFGHRHDAAGADRQSRHHRALGHQGVPQGVGRGQGRDGADRPLRCRLLCGVHGRRQGRGHQPPRRLGRDLGVALRGRRRLRAGAGDGRAGGAGAARHRGADPSQVGRGEVRRALRARTHRADLFRPHPVSDRAGRRQGRGQADQRRVGAVAALQVGAQARGLHRGLQVAGQRLRRAGADLALPRRGPAVLCGAAVRALDAAVRPGRSRPQGADQALCPARLHHRRCRPAAALSPLRARRDRQRGPAAQRLARDAAEQPAGRPDPHRRHRPRAGRAGEHRREGRRQVQEDLGSVRPGAQGGAVRGSRAARAAAGPVPLRQHARRTSRARSSSTSPTSSPTRPRSITWSARASSG